MDQWESTWSRSVRSCTAKYIVLMRVLGYTELVSFADSYEMAQQIMRLFKLEALVEARKCEKAARKVVDWDNVSLSAAMYNPRGWDFSVREMKEKYKRLVPLTFNHHNLPLYFGKRAFLRRLVRLMDKRKVPRLYLACIAHNFTGHGYWSQHVDKVKRLADVEDFDAVWPKDSKK